MLTKSLHTVTAATNVARLLFSRDTSYATRRSPTRLAIDALSALGYGFALEDMDAALGVDPTVTRIHKACESIIDDYVAKLGPKPMSAEARAAMYA